MTKKTPELCEYCGMDKAIRNPSGKCDHLYYPDNVNKSLKKKSLVGWVSKYYFDILPHWTVKNIYGTVKFMFQDVYKYKKDAYVTNTSKPKKVRITIEEI